MISDQTWVDAKILHFELCGKLTCASESGKFCQFVRTRKMKTEYVCNLFEQPLVDENGWLRRCGQCLEKFTEKNNATS